MSSLQKGVGAMGKNTPDISAIMKDLTTRDFLKFGVDHISYIRPAPLNARQAWSIFSADGQKISVHLTEDAAMAASRQRDLRPVRVH
jgi:hypothetical protein